jgi:hypothetical protein
MLGRSLWTRTTDPSSAMSRPIEGGQISCPIRGVVDIERCFMCPAFDGIREGTTERLLCRPERDPSGLAALDEVWQPD